MTLAKGDFVGKLKTNLGWADSQGDVAVYVKRLQEPPELVQGEGHFLFEVVDLSGSSYDGQDLVQFAKLRKVK